MSEGGLAMERTRSTGTPISRRGIFTSTGFSAAALAAAGCGAGESDQAPPAAAVKPAKVDFLGRAPGVYQQTFEDLSRLFQQRTPNVTVTYTHEAGNFDEKYQTLIAAGQQPDVFFSSN